MSKPRQWWIGYDELDRMHAFDTKVAADSFYKAIYHEGSVHHVIEYSAYEKLLEDNRRMAEAFEHLLEVNRRLIEWEYADEAYLKIAHEYKLQVGAITKEALTAHEQTMRELE